VSARAAILPTICLVKGAPALRFMDARVPGISVPPEIIARVEAADDPAEEAFALALEQARHALALPGVRGLHLTDFRHDGSVARLCAELGIATRHERDSTHAHRPALPV
jgi:methylenetetrahydrofolate reductase (NADPH)